MKTKVLVSVSGGETSMFMAQWILKNMSGKYELIFIFANTGQENEETLIFVQKCSDYFGFPIVWVEGVFHKELGIGTTHKVVSFKSACRDGRLFNEFIAIYGIPNQANPQCTRELKAQVIKSFARSIGWKKYYTAIGIRSDESDRINSKAKRDRLIYPLIRNIPTTKPEINVYWSNMPFRLNLKSWQGNCKWCWKKSLPKLIRIAKDNPEYFDVPKQIEKDYGNFFPEHRKQKWLDEGKELPKNITFFRGNRSSDQILEMSKYKNPQIIDESKNINVQLGIFVDPENLDLLGGGGDSCEVFSECNG